MVVFRGLEVTSGDELHRILFIIFATLQAISIFMFIINIAMTLLVIPKVVAPTKPEPKKEPAPQTIKSKFDVDDDSTKPNMSVTPETQVAELVDRLPSLQQVLVDCGLLSLQMPGHIDKVRQMGITIGMAAANHSLDIDSMILKIETELQANGFSTKPNLFAHLQLPQYHDLLPEEHISLGCGYFLSHQ